MPQALSEIFSGGCTPCSDVLRANPAQTTPSSYAGNGRENFGHSRTSPTYLKAPPENMRAALPSIERLQEPGAGFL